MGASRYRPCTFCGSMMGTWERPTLHAAASSGNRRRNWTVGRLL